MNISTLFYIAAAVLALLVGFGLIDPAHEEIVWGWVAVGLIGTGLAIQSFGDRRIG